MCRLHILKIATVASPIPLFCSVSLPSFREVGLHFHPIEFRLDLVTCLYQGGGVRCDTI